MSSKSAVVGLACCALVAAGVVCAIDPATETSAGTRRGRIEARSARKPTRVCATPNLSDHDIDFIERWTLAEQRRKGRRVPEAMSADAVMGTIPVAFHVVYYDSVFYGTEGLLTEEQVQSQIDALNAAYSNVEFELASISYTNNREYFFHTPGSNMERTMKLAIGANSSQYLNLYSTGLSYYGLLGYATFPWELRRGGAVDGVVVSYDSIPDGEFPFDEGDTAVHEVGHWMGLYHTFQGGCRRRGDVVADTPSAAAAFYGCSLMAPDTCPNAGLDPIFNFMDYSDDACLDHFTAGQAERMNRMLSMFRAELFQ